MSYLKELKDVLPVSYDENSAWAMIKRCGGLKTSLVDVEITGTGSQTVNVFEFTGTIRIINQHATITEVTTLNNLTGLYADIYDGTNTVNLTDNGAVLSGAPVETFLTKDKVFTETYSVNLADECRLNETTGDKREGRPFTITAKNGVTNYIRLHYTTTDNPVSFKMRVCFEYLPVCGGTLTEV